MHTEPPRLFLKIKIPEHPISPLLQKNLNEDGSPAFSILRAKYKDVNGSVNHLAINWFDEGITPDGVDSTIKETGWYDVIEKMGVIAMSTATFWQYFGDYLKSKNKTLGLDFLIDLNIKEYEKFEKDVKELEILISTSKDTDQIMAKATGELLDNYINHKKRFVKWFLNHNVKIPVKEKGTVLSIESNIDEQKPISEKKPSFKLKSKEAFELLINLENDKYVLSPKEENILGHVSFKRYQSDYIKKLIGDTFDSAFAELDKQGTLAHDKFFQITIPPSDWYKPRFIESFNSHCTNKKTGKYFERCKGRTFNKDSNIRIGEKRESAFTLR